NSSLSSRLSVRAPQLTRTYGPVDLGLRSWTARAISSLPVPVSPTIRTQARDGATWRIVRKTWRIEWLSPMTPGNAASGPPDADPDAAPARECLAYGPWLDRESMGM